MFLEKIINYYRQFGLARTVCHSLARVGFAFYYRKMLFYEKDLCQLNGDPHREFTGMHLEHIDEEKLKAIDNYYDGWRTKDGALRRLQKGYQLFSLKEHTERLSYIWVDTGSTEVPYLQLRFPLPEGHSCLAYLYTVKDHRNRGVATLSTQRTMRLFGEKGYTRMISFVLPKNVTVQRVNQKLGFRRFGACTYIRILFLKIYVCRSLFANRRKLFFPLGKNSSRLLNSFSKS
ncbi:MAG: hypothetical protein JSW40_09555 [Candidatus Omnitrophota bacterium]|nr:MAG: hypothetical protein JSW40_09555 [Candidatus Omnitrophota bacterium]